MTTRVVLARAVVALAFAGLGTWTVAAAAAGRDAFVPGALFVLATAVFFVAPGAVGLPPPPAVPAERSFVSYHVPLIVLRGSVWLLFAAEAAVHPLGLPALGDVPAALQAFAVVGGLALLSRHRTTARAVRLLVDSLLTSAAATLALWVTVIGPRAAGGVRDVVAVALCFVFVLQVVAVVHVVVRDRTPHWPLAAGTIVGVGGADVLVVLAGLGPGPRAVGVPAAVLSCAGALLSAVTAYGARTRPPQARAVDDAGEARASSASVLLVVACLAVTVLARPGGPGLPPGRAGAALGLAVVAAFAARDLLLARARGRLTTLLRRQAAVDPLTGLANRRGLTDTLERLAGDRRPWVVLALDLDGFKAVNDLHGHHAGDAVLVDVGAVLRAHCPPGGLAARTGGDEFALVFPGDLGDGERLAGRIVAAVRGTAGSGPGAPLTTSVGVGQVAPAGSPDRVDPLVAFVEAGAALRSAKAAGRDTVRVYTGTVAREHARRLLVESRLRAAVGSGALHSVAQPIVDLRTRRLVAVEALARWDDPVLGPVPPSEFVPAAEAAGLVGAVGAAVRAHAVAGYRACLTGSGVRLAVNVSPLELGAPGVLDELSALRERAGLAAGDLVVEVTEAVLIARGDPALRTLAALDDLGVGVSIDDFGSGYSALGYLRRLPVSAVKIDRELLGEALTSVRTRHIVAGVADLAARLGLPVTVEGIEDADGARLAVELGAVLGQGYWFSRPVPWPELAGAASPAHPGAAAG